MSLSELPAKNRPDPSARALDQWVRDAVRLTGEQERRVGWMLASTVVIAALQRALGDDGHPLWLAKGGVYIQLQLGQGSRATQDIDTLFRGTAAQFETALADVLSQPWGPFTLQAFDLEEIAGARRLVKPRRFEVRLIVKGTVWRRVRVEASFPEGRIADHGQPVPTPPVRFFGVEAPDHLAGIAMDYQVAQKFHAASDPDTDGYTNDRVRDIIDLALLRDHFYPGDPPSSLRQACLDLFDARAAEAEQLGYQPRHWPPTMTQNQIWHDTYPGLAESIGLALTLDDAVADVHDWIGLIDHTGTGQP
ncbi:MAG: nucleotidyl transferase AbiEii/AbiGii toxin family protein [Propionibacteriaceae bacterium]|jgi:hypothetical protein|nr:nucleotidyl transferase AbiEii/AbiGii toxin family protein [Propionibacteriaceae bacterium]